MAMLGGMLRGLGLGAGFRKRPAFGVLGAWRECPGQPVGDYCGSILVNWVYFPVRDNSIIFQYLISTQSGLGRHAARCRGEPQTGPFGPLRAYCGPIKVNWVNSWETIFISYGYDQNSGASATSPWPPARGLDQAILLDAAANPKQVHCGPIAGLLRSIGSILPLMIIPLFFSI